MVRNPVKDRKYYFKVSLIFYFCWILCFISVGKYAATLPTRDLTSSLDRLIPLVPVFIWPYELCYIFPFLPILILRDWHRFNRAILAVIIACLTAFVVYFLVPISFPRPNLGNSISDSILGLEYALDFYPGANKLPSLHVAYAWIVYFVCRNQVANKSREFLILFVAVLITISTVFVKQHIIIDSAAGVAWAAGAWWLSGLVYPRFADITAEPRPALKQMLKRILPFVLIYLTAIFLAVDFHWERLVKW
jgi:membrane-associated phospholipid phosphatase